MAAKRETDQDGFDREWKCRRRSEPGGQSYKGALQDSAAESWKDRTFMCRSRCSRRSGDLLVRFSMDTGKPARSRSDAWFACGESERCLGGSVRVLWKARMRRRRTSSSSFISGGWKTGASA